MELYAIRYGSNPGLLGFYLMNEPFYCTDGTVLRNYYMNAYSRIRAKVKDIRIDIVSADTVVRWERDQLL